MRQGNADLVHWHIYVALGGDELEKHTDLRRICTIRETRAVFYDKYTRHHAKIS